jgi:alcohol dehydrogenase class IV
LAGKAINISRTTASHAISYKITSDYGIPHGHAVALTIAKLFEFNTKDNKFGELKELISAEPVKYFNQLFNQIGLENNLVKLGITDFQTVADNVNLERLSNNPTNLKQDNLLMLLKG